MPDVLTLDLNFQGFPGRIASYLLPYAGGTILIECGPGSTRAALESGLASHGYSPADVTDLFVTHIHLDHAGAAGWLAGFGARVHVHSRGLPHLADPSRLLASAARIYGDQMDALWGEMLPVPPEKLHPLSDGQVVDFGPLQIVSVDTPGHATHHMAFMVDDLCFSGDVGGIRLAGPRHILLPMPPPEFHFEMWLESWEKLCRLGAARIAPTHYGIYDDAAAHLELLGSVLHDTGSWIAANLPDAEPEAVTAALTEWFAGRARRAGLSEEGVARYENTNSSESSANGLLRYWQKFRAVQRSS